MDHTGTSLYYKCEIMNNTVVMIFLFAFRPSRRTLTKGVSGSPLSAPTDQKIVTGSAKLLSIIS